MIGIYKPNLITGIGATHPQGETVNIVSEGAGWHIVEITDIDTIHLQEYGIKPISTAIVSDLEAPKGTGPAYDMDGRGNSYGDHMRIEMNPGQINEDGSKMEIPDFADNNYPFDISKEDVTPYKTAIKKLKNITTKEIARAVISEKVNDTLDLMADTKIILQMGLQYLAYEWKHGTPSITDATLKEKIDTVTENILNASNKDIVYERALLKFPKLFENEKQIQEIVQKEYFDKKL